MTTQTQIHDSLFHRPIIKAALYAALYHKKAASRSTFELREWHVEMYVKICNRFKIKGLVYEFETAAAIN